MRRQSKKTKFALSTVILFTSFTVLTPVAQLLGHASSVVTSSVSRENTATNLLQKNTIRSATDALDQSPSEIEDLANRAYSGTVVNTADEFIKAYNDQTVDKITLGSDITPTATQMAYRNIIPRTKSLEIDGNNFTFTQPRGCNLRIGEESEANQLFHIHDLKLAAASATASQDVAGSYGFIAGSTQDDDNLRDGSWSFKVGNVQTVNSKIARIIRAYHSSIDLYGKLNLDTTAENWYTGGITIEDNTTYIGNINTSNYSLCWFVEDSDNIGNTGTNKFIVGKNCVLRLSKTSSGTGYPAVYQNAAAGTNIIGEGSRVDVSMPGAAIRMDYDNTTWDIQSNAYLNATSKSNATVINYQRNNNCAITTEPGAEFYVIGAANSLISMDDGSNNTFTFNAPKTYDIRNTATNGIALSVGEDNTFSINNSDIDLWKKNSDLTVGSDGGSYFKVDNFKYNNGVTSSDSTLQSSFGDIEQYRRITGLNQAPETIFETPVTNADYTIKARMSLGLVPDSQGLRPDGTIHYENVWAGIGGGITNFTDSFNVLHSLSPAADGGIIFTDTKFQDSTKKLLFSSSRGPWIESEKSQPIIDVTPPQPANLTNTSLDTNSKILSGTSSEVGATVIVQINGTAITTTTTVASDGTWSVDLPSLNSGDIVQVLLNDNTGKIDPSILADVPSTNNVMGNQNPTEDITYHDATFKAGPKLTVTEGIHARNYIIKESDAKSLTQAQLEGFMNVSVSTPNLGTHVLAAAHTGLNNAPYLDIPVEWSDSNTSSTTTTHLVVVPDSALIAQDSQTALDVYDIDITSKQANAIAEQSSLDNYTKVLAINSDGSVHKATLVNSSTLLSQLKSVNTTASFVADYEYGSLSKSVAVNITAGSLAFTSAPTTLDFGVHSISNQELIVFPKLDQNLQVTDTRTGIQATDWTLAVNLSDPLTQVGGNETLDDVLYYSNGNTKNLLGSNQTLVATKADSSNGKWESKDWGVSNKKGISLEAPVTQQKVGSYQGTLLWTLNDTP
jgi:hypothetical protein